MCSIKNYKFTIYTFRFKYICYKKSLNFLILDFWEIYDILQPKITVPKEPESANLTNNVGFLGQKYVHK